MTALNFCDCLSEFKTSFDISQLKFKSLQTADYTGYVKYHGYHFQDAFAI